MHPGTPNVEKKLRAVSNPKSRAGFQLGGHPGYEDVSTSGTGPPNASNCEASCLAGSAASTGPNLPGGVGSGAPHDEDSEGGSSTFISSDSDDAVREYGAALGTLHLNVMLRMVL